MLSHRLPSVALASMLTLAACQDGPSDPASPLVGTWRLLSWELTDSVGDISYPFGQRPEGQIIYTETGRMSVQVRRPDLPLDSLSGVTQDNFVAQVSRTFISYYGTYAIDAAASTVTHHVEGSLRPSRLGTDQLRG